MTDKIMEARRAKFETWYEEYTAEGWSVSKIACWTAYNAGLDSLCVELPHRWNDDGCGAFYKEEQGPHMDSHEVIESILSERAELKRDAERYRWLRDCDYEIDGADFGVWLCDNDPLRYYAGAELDSTIDAAIHAAGVKTK